MSVKVKILSENKKQKIDESMMDLLSDPTMLAAGGAGLMMLYQALFGKKPDPEESLEKVRQQINQKYARAMAGMESSNKERDLKNKMKDARLKTKLDDLKKQRSMNLPPIDEPSDAIGIPMKDDADIESSDVKVPSAAVVRRFAKAKKIADDPRTATGDAENAQRKVDKMREEYPGIDDHPDIKLYEAFVRFI